MIKLSNITKVFQQGTRTIQALNNVSLHVPAGQIYGVIGASGAGKSTLIRCVNLLERPTEGSVQVGGQELTTLSESELTKARRQIGMIFQHFNLLSSRTVFGNVALPLELDNTPKEEVKRRVTELLDLVGLGDKHDSYPANLSVDKNSVWRSPVRWQVIPKCCCAMKPPAHSIQQRHARFWNY